MKTPFLLAAALLCMYPFRHLVADADPQVLARWNQQKREADGQLVGEMLGYQACLAELPRACPRSEAGRQSAVWQSRARVQAAREKAIAVLQHKPGTLTILEAQRLAYYTTGLPERPERGLPGCEEMP